MAIFITILLFSLGFGFYFLRLFADGRRLHEDLRDRLTAFDDDAYEPEADLLSARALPRTP